ncbi:MFS transporter [Streptomyces sp. NRRL B-1381]|uniref:MFS transporter n=1 Tax=Streptomyces sp. NRRL B-1381 TaxID=1463829 RepID=UPI00099DFDB4|nr:MFS transporter [Streptomyces sp. NRRL B-1381]
MTLTTSAGTGRAGARGAYWSTAAAFFSSGLLLTTWMARIPTVKDATGLSEGALGSVLVVSVLGSLLSMQFTSWLVALFDSRTLVGLAVPVAAATLWVLSFASSGLQLAALLLLFGLADGVLYVSMNVRGIAVERASQRPCLNFFHACWSIGALVAALLSIAFTALDWSMGNHFFIVSMATAALALLVIAPPWQQKTAWHEESHRSKSQTPVQRLPDSATLGLGLLGLCCLVAQGAIEDWGGVFIKEGQGGSTVGATVGFTAFCGALTLGRLFGDHLRARYATAPLLRCFAALALAGLSLALLSSDQNGTIAGFALFGLGLSILDPVIASAAGHSTGPEDGEGGTAQAIAHVATLGHTGLLLGPPAIGWVAEFTGLRWALLAPGIAVLTVGTTAAFITKRIPSDLSSGKKRN